MMSHTSKRELLRVVRPRYTLSNRTAKRQILDEFVAATGYHRKYAIHVLNHPPKRTTAQRRGRRSKYTGRVRAALEKVWRIANCICGKRLVSVLPQYVEALERHGELELDPETRLLLLTLSAATADRLLARARTALGQGKYVFEGQNLRFLKGGLGGGPGCRDAEASYEVYVAQRDGEAVSLRFVLVGDDACADRKESLAGKKLPRAK